MPDLLTPQTLASAGPLVLDTFFKHFFSHKSLTARSKARGDDLLYDEAFVLMKTFLESATKYPVASLQKFGQVRTPAPPAVALHHITISPRILGLAADYLTAAFGGEEMAFKIAGGSKWWQVRAGAGVEAEWIVMKKDYREWEREVKRASSKEGQSKTPRKARDGENGKEKASGKRSANDMAGMAEATAPSGAPAAASSSGASGSNSPHIPAKEETHVGDDGQAEGCFRSEMDEMRCMLYIHGGAYYWGSINTHRYTIWRYARKMRGRCFAVNYRKAPQYPFPCAIQDCLAAYLYLTRPPPEAKHHPIRPDQIIIAGDSAGGGLVLALLQILRDTEGLEVPAGAVLISPWSDLTHSFPSILHNTSTDIVPPYSFIHKPSSLWPPPPPGLTNVVQSTIKSKIKEFAHHLRYDPEKAVHQSTAKDGSPKAMLDIPLQGQPMQLSEKLRSSQLGNKRKFSMKTKAKAQKADLHPTTTQGDASLQPDPVGEPSTNPSRANPADAWSRLKSRSEPADEGHANWSTLAKCDYPVELDIQGEQVMIDTQIQLYATNAQLCYPLVSPVLGYLGGLCPLYVCCGDNEVLRDEIIFLAANPEKYPLRDDVRRMMPHYEGIEGKYGPTQVHLQVFDGTCHDLPLFSMCRSARGVFRAIATFARHVTPSASVMPAAGGGSTPRIRKSGAKGDTSIFLSPFSGISRRSSGKNESVAVDSGKATSTSGLDRAASVGHADERRASDGSPLHSGSDRDLAPPIPASSYARTSFSNSASSSIGQRLDELVLGEALAPVASPQPMSPVEPLRARPTAERTISDMSMSSSGSEAYDEIPSQRILAPIRTAPSGDDAGPRWGHEEDVANPAKPGQAGHPSVYRGPNAYKDNMIRERVDPHGHLRPLEPISELGAMTMPADEIGTIKEGPAMRYLTGQYLWDKRYKRARRQVEKHRERNLLDAREKDGRRIVEGVKGRYESHKARKEARGDEVGMEGEREEGEGGGEESGGDREEDWSWGWAWALDGEVPPPSAIVSRRDTSEARNLALIADRLDSAKPTALGGLSIWVALTTFFSNTSEESATQAVKEARGTRSPGTGVTSADATAESGSESDEGDLEAGGGGGRKASSGEAGRGGADTGVVPPERRASAFERIGHALGLK